MTWVTCGGVCVFVVQVILQGPTSAEKVFEAKEYEVFRSQNLVQSAVAFARVRERGVGIFLV